MGAVLAISTGLVLILSGVEWDRRPSTIEGTPEVTPDGRRASVAGRGNEVPVQEVASSSRDMADARSPVDKKPAGIAPPAPKGPSLPAAAAEAREIAPIQKPPVDRSPAIKAARVAAVKPISPIGSAPMDWWWAHDADNRRGQYQGTVALQVNVQPSGRVSNCAPVRGSGAVVGLDRLTCRLVQQRARFIPARDPRGKRVVGQAYITFAWCANDGIECHAEVAPARWRSNSPMAAVPNLHPLELGRCGPTRRCASAGLPRNLISRFAMWRIDLIGTLQRLGFFLGLRLSCGRLGRRLSCWVGIGHDILLLGGRLA